MVHIGKIVRINGGFFMKKNVFISGASHGIGRAAALCFAKEGYSLIINCKNSKRELLELEESLKQTYHIDCTSYVGDIGDSAFVHEMFQDISKTFGGIDILINNAGISYLGLLGDMSNEEWSGVMSTNLNSVFYCSREVIPYMLSKKCGRIINVSSVWGNVGASMEVAYSTAKGGVNSFTRALAKELAPSNIQVNAVAFGTIDTRMNVCFSEEERRMLEDEIPQGRFGTPEEAAQFIFQISTAPEYLTGQVMTFDGGWC